MFLKTTFYTALVAICFLASSTYCSGQFLKSLQYGVGYFGNNWMNPGVATQATKVLLDTKKTGKKYTILGDSRIDLDGTLGVYWDPFSHVGVNNTYGLTFDQYFGRRVGLEVGAGVAFQGTFTGDNYVVDDMYNVQKQLLKANYYSGIFLSVGTFIDNKLNTKSLLSRLSIQMLGPYNTTVIPVFNYQLIYLL